MDTVDIGAYEVPGICSGLRETTETALNKTSFNIYPNPAYDFLQIETNLEDIHIQIYNAIGVLIMNTTSRKIDVSHLPSGVYIAQLLDDNKVISTKKWIKE